METGSARTRPATSHQHRARPDWARHRLEGINRARRGHRHHDRRRQAGLWHLRRPGRVRARVDRGAHDCRPSLGPRARAERRPAVQDDRRQAAAGDGGNGSARDQGRRPVPGTWRGTVAKLAMRQPFVLFKGLTFQKLCLPGAFRPGDHHNKMLRPGLCVVHASPQYL